MGGTAKLDSAIALLTYNLLIYMQLRPRDPSHRKTEDRQPEGPETQFTLLSV